MMDVVRDIYMDNIDFAKKPVLVKCMRLHIEVHRPESLAFESSKNKQNITTVNSTIGYSATSSRDKLLSYHCLLSYWPKESPLRNALIVGNERMHQVDHA